MNPIRSSGHNLFITIQGIISNFHLRWGRSYSTLKHGDVDEWIGERFGEPIRRTRHELEGSATMNVFVRQFVQFIRSEEGPTATEYAVLLGVICIGVLSTMALFGDHMNALYVTLAGTLTVF